MQVKDVMTTNVITVAPDTEIKTAAAALSQHHISAVPVVDGQQRLVGIVSEGDLIHRQELGTERRRSWWLNLFSLPDERAVEYIRSHSRHVADVMTRDVVTVTEDMPLQDVAELLEKRRIKRVPVLRNNKLVGVVSRANLVQALAVQRRPDTAPAEGDDRAIRQQVLAAAERELSIPMTTLNVIVDDGVVHLWGAVEASEQRKALQIAAENVPGVKRVENQLSLFSEMFRGGL